MKQGIHPEYRPVVFMDTTTGFKFLSGSTKSSNETVQWEDGNEYPLLRVEITSDSHPFYTGRQKFTQADGRVDRFNKKIRSQIRTLQTLSLRESFFCAFNTFSNRQGRRLWYYWDSAGKRILFISHCLLKQNSGIPEKALKSFSFEASNKP